MGVWKRIVLVTSTRPRRLHGALGYCSVYTFSFFLYSCCLVAGYYIAVDSLAPHFIMLFSLSFLLFPASPFLPLPLCLHCLHPSLFSLSPLSPPSHLTPTPPFPSPFLDQRLLTLPVATAGLWWLQQMEVSTHLAKKQDRTRSPNQVEGALSLVRACSNHNTVLCLQRVRNECNCTSAARMSL